MFKILLTTILLGLIPLFILTILQYLLEKFLKIKSHIPENQTELDGLALYSLQFFSDLLFFVIIPTLAYFWLYPILPFAGYKTGIAVGISAYILGSLPYATNPVSYTHLTLPTN